MAKILFLAHRIPYPPNKGDKIRSWHFLEHLAKSHEVHLGFYVDDPKDVRHIEFLRSKVASMCYQRVSKLSLMCRALTGFFSGQPFSFAAYPKRKLGKFVKQRFEAGDVDLVFLFSGAVAPLIGKNWYSTPVLADLVDVDSEKWAAYGRTASFPKSVLYAREASRLRREEITIAEQAAVTTFVSEDEAALFQSMLEPENKARVDFINNGVDLKAFDPQRFVSIRPCENTVIFTGAMDYPPNIEAAEWFVDQIWPTVLARKPSARFVIAGGPVPSRVKALADQPNVDVLGYVEDMPEAIASASVVVAPLQTARGIQNKVLEGMAMAKAIVATPAAKEGIEADPVRHLIVSEQPSDFAASVISLLEDTAHAEALGKAARQQIEERYSWSTSLAKLDRLVADLLGPPSK